MREMNPESLSSSRRLGKVAIGLLLGQIRTLNRILNKENRDDVSEDLPITLRTYIDAGARITRKFLLDAGTLFVDLRDQNLWPSFPQSANTTNLSWIHLSGPLSETGDKTPAFVRFSR
jgi:hypothetical protein